ncbi:MAG: extracellular solute-binding protein [Caldilineaceae bacterium]|nr:extracellular solute-binding protein [Caldilineaceae bacterium]MCB9157267.1 extracellular solute-binding protein [Caldilineaceae bacterium]
MNTQKNRLSRRDFLRVSGMAAMVTAIAACTAPQASTGDEASGGGEDGIEIVYLAWSGPEELKVLQTIIDGFQEANPGLTVKVEVPPDNYWDKLQTMVAGGVAPDMFRMDYVYMAVWGAKGIPISLDDYVDADIDKSTLAAGYEQVFQAYSHEGKQLGLPQDVNTQVLFYNKQMFDAAGIDYPSESWKWDASGGDFLEAALALTSDEQWGYSQDWYWEPIAPWIWENGGDWYDSEITKSTMSDPKTMEGVQFLADLLLTHQASPTPAQMAGRDAPTLFTTGKIAMYQSGRWQVPTLRSVEGLDWDVTVLPEGVGGRSTTLGGTASCISNQSQHPEETWKYVKWYLTETAQGLIGELAYSTPLLKSVLESKEFMESVPPQNNGVWLQSMEWIRPMPVDGHFDEVDTIRSTEFTEIWTGRKSVADACQAIDEQVNALMA